MSITNNISDITKITICILLGNSYVVTQYKFEKIDKENIELLEQKEIIKNLAKITVLW